MMKITIIGSGTWGTALGQVLCDNGHDVLIYGRVESQVRQINEEHRNTDFFPDGNLLPDSLKATTDLRHSLSEAEMIILAVPTSAIREVLNSVIGSLDHKAIFVNASKGFDPVSNSRMSVLIREIIPIDRREEVVSLIGPSHAEEVILRHLTSLCSVSLDEEVAGIVQEAFSNSYFRIYVLTDEVGAELGVALKNSIAIASGILEGLGFGDNARAALVTRGLHEMVRFGTYFGGEMHTYLGLTGLGDLMVTCNSRHSRNFNAGLQIGKDDSAHGFLATNKGTVEGIRTTKVVHQLAHAQGIDMPIIEAIYKVIYENQKPSDVIKTLMIRPLKKEED